MSHINSTRETKGFISFARATAQLGEKVENGQNLSGHVTCLGRSDLDWIFGG